ncbi:beta eliminating lyase [Novymonas esmeraldas]|uniref:Beta eliminating lyase n=1 Tax=Novymonas esmeraldas TaxID=1808958 RepID=A0AAW0ENA5_9TRYP
MATTTPPSMTSPTPPPSVRGNFASDYSSGVHPAILDAMVRENTARHVGYGLDTRCENAAQLVRQATQQPNADVHFLVGGTQTNLVACALALRPWEAVIATQLGHVSTFECGAIEATGHKVFVVQSPDGKMRIPYIERALRENVSEHMVLPRLVYVSNTTETGTQYTKSELEELSAFCRAHGMYFFLDGARLASALSSPLNDLSLADIAALTDMFYIGATKAGGMFGEALVIMNDALKPNARYCIKQRGGLLAKGWMLGIQFEVLLRDNLFFEIGAHENKMASILKAGVEECGITFAWPSASNQQFPILPNAMVTELAKDFDFSIIEALDDGTSIVRLCTSWATQEDECHRFVAALKRVVSSAVA